MDTVLGILSRPDPLGHCRNTPACPTHVPPMYRAYTSHVPGLHLPIPSQAHGLYLACITHVPGFGSLSAFIILPSSFAFGGFARPFCILHSAFYLRSGVALGSHWGGFRVAWGWLWGAYRLAINTLWGGFDVALMWLWGGLGRRLNRDLPGALHSALYLCPSVGVADGKSWPTAYEAGNRWRRSGRRLASRPHSQ